MVVTVSKGLGPGGLTINDREFIVHTTCIPGSSHGGKAKSQEPSFLDTGPAYDQQDTTSLLGGSGGELTFFCHFHVLHHTSSCNSTSVRHQLTLHEK